VGHTVVSEQKKGVKAWGIGSWKFWQKAMTSAVSAFAPQNAFRPMNCTRSRNNLGDPLFSISSNIAEGYGRNSRSELHQFVGIARGSLSEVETQLELAQMPGYISLQKFAFTAEGVWRDWKDVDWIERVGGEGEES